MDFNTYINIMKNVLDCSSLTKTIRVLIECIVKSDVEKKRLLNIKDETLRKYVSNIDLDSDRVIEPVRKSVYKLFKNIKKADLDIDKLIGFLNNKKSSLEIFFPPYIPDDMKNDVVNIAANMFYNFIINSNYTNPYIKKHTPKYNNEVNSLLTEASYRCSYCKRSLYFDHPQTKPLYEVLLLTSRSIKSDKNLNTTVNSIKHKLILCPICKTRYKLMHIPSDNTLINYKDMLAYASAHRIEEHINTEKILINIEKIKEINDMYNSGDIKPLCESDFTEYYPKRIEEKLDDCDAILCERIKSDNAIFFQYYKQYLQQIFTYGDTNFDVIRNFIKEQYKSKEKIIDDYGEICYYLVESIRKALDLNVITSELLIAYFIQDCEVF